MSSLIVEICNVDKVEQHPNADRLSICTIKGWKVCTAHLEDGTPRYKPGDRCIYVPPDSILPTTLAEALDVIKYTSPVKTSDGAITGYRVRVARLRSEPSYGMIIGNEYCLGLDVGEDVATKLNITKWEPPQLCTDGDAEAPHPAFHKYTDIENIKNFPGLLKDGEQVVFTEKIHGKNCRVGYIRDTDNEGNAAFRFMAGSHDVRRKQFQTQQKKKKNHETGEEELITVNKTSQFWEVLNDINLQEMIKIISLDQKNVIIFGEMYGDGVQDITYGCNNGQWKFRVFDISVNSKYLNDSEVEFWCATYLVNTVPVLYRGPFSQEKVEEFVGGPTRLCSQAEAGKFKEREGLVIKPIVERSEATEKKVFDRVILKAINFKYLERKGGTEHK